MKDFLDHITILDQPRPRFVTRPPSTLDVLARRHGLRVLCCGLVGLMVTAAGLGVVIFVCVYEYLVARKQG